MSRTMRIILIIVVAVVAVFLVVRFWDDVSRFFNGIGRRIKKICPNAYADEHYNLDFDGVAD